MDTISVAELNGLIKDTLTEDPRLQDVWVAAEVGRCSEAASGHWYFTIKDEECSLDCVMWKGVASNQLALPEQGAAYHFHGKVTMYTRGGKVQLQVDEVLPEGLGDLHARFEALKARLKDEGLFEQRRPLPRYPRVIGVVTSLQAAALGDVCHVLERRWPSVEVRVAPTRVQGAEAPAEIVAAIEAIGRAGVDVAIITRGGGSLEDLWAFNDEAVARALFACPVPTVSGVGHETDTTIADFVADRRAPTPSAAAEVATPDGEELRQAVDDLVQRLRSQATMRMRAVRREHADRDRRLHLRSPRHVLGRARQDLHAARQRLERGAIRAVRDQRLRVESLADRLQDLSPHAVLSRGYAHVRRDDDGRTVRSTSDVAPAAGIRVRVADGAFDAVVAGQGRLFDLTEGTDNLPDDA